MKDKILSSFVFAAVLILTGCREDLTPVTRTEFLLGTTCSVTLFEKAPEVFEQVFTSIKEIEKRMSAHLPDSEVNLISRAKTAGAKVSEDTFYVIQQGLYFSEKSGGKFDITIAPLVRLWGIGTENQKIPDDKEIASILDLINFRYVAADKSTGIITLNEGQSIDLGGIAKGYAADRAAEILRKNNISAGIINLGGNVITAGRKADGSLWKVGIQDPEGAPGTYIGIIEVDKKAVVTSGTYERYFEKDGVRYHHLLDTETGYPVRNNLKSVAIIADKGITADALSTTAFLFGLKKGMKYINSIPDAQALFITKDKEIYITDGIKKNFYITNKDYFLKVLNDD